MFVCAICNPVRVCLPVFVRCVLPVLAVCVYVCVCLRVYSIPVCVFFIVCLSAVAQRAHVVCLRVCIVSTDTHTHTHIHTRSRFWCPSLTCSVQDFLQDVATKPVPDSSVSPSPFFFSSVLPPRLFVFRERERHTNRQRDRERIRENERERERKGEVCF